MALSSLFSPRRRATGSTEANGETGAATTAAPPRRVAISAGELRRERRALLRERDQQVRDLGGLALEMFRRDSFREHLLYERCAEVAAIDERLFEVERLLDSRRPPTARCACGAPVFRGSHFCGNCGRPMGDAVVACAACGHALNADARYCPAYGSPAPA
jgi:uncharacterized protein YjiS (DUF1127 family)